MKTSLTKLFFFSTTLYLGLLFSYKYFNHATLSPKFKVGHDFPAILLLEGTYFFAATYLVYGLVFLYITLSCFVNPLFRKQNSKVKTQIITLKWLISLLLIHLLNSAFFPHSLFKVSVAEIIPYAIILLVSLHLLITIIFILKHYGRLKWAPAFAAIGFTFVGFKHLPSSEKESVAPNVIMIGIDSLRPDYINRGPEFEVVMPTLEQEIANDAVIISTAYTPLARTFPSWMSILSGLEVQNHGALYNLINQDRLIDKQRLISSRFQENNYRTVYATDEKRFSNIDETFGFDALLGPRIGVMDFALGKLNDIPLNNLLTNSVLGKLAFPYNHSNRASSHTYLPSSFDDLLDSELNGQNQPIFFNVHYCLAHWPFSWAKKSPSLTREEEYLLALNRIDQQIESLFEKLRKQKLLDNTIVVFLSDHGESLGLPEDHFMQAETYGHGTTLLSLAQNKVFLAFKYYGENDTIRQKVASITHQHPVSLMDIAPTIADLAGLSPAAYNYDGINLVNPKPNAFSRSIKLETGFWIPGIEGRIPDQAALIEAGMTHYNIGGQGRLTIKPESRAMIIYGKEHGFIEEQTMYLLAPNKGKYDHYIADILENRIIPAEEYSLYMRERLVHFERKAKAYTDAMLAERH